MLRRQVTEAELTPTYSRDHINRPTDYALIGEIPQGLSINLLREDGAWGVTRAHLLDSQENITFGPGYSRIDIRFVPS
jgi:hypothetical protein